MMSSSHHVAAPDSLELPPDAFELIYSAFAFHYVEDFRRLVTMMHRALAAKGALVFTIEHPIFMAAANPRWIDDGGGRKTWPVNQYSMEGERRTKWFTDGVLKYHRTMATTLNTLIRAGFQTVQKNSLPRSSKSTRTLASPKNWNDL